jgi:uncharacterized protein
MKERENVQTLKDAYAAFTRGDIVTLMKTFAHDIEWHVPGPKEAPYAGKHRGTDQVGRFFAQVADTIEFTTFEPREYVAQGDRVVVLGHYAGRVKATGRSFAADWAMVWTLREGKAVTFQEYTDTQTLGAAYR